MSPYMATNLRHYSASAPAIERFNAIPPERRARPVVKWAGSRARLLPGLDPLFPTHFETYHEPFVGGGSIYFFLHHVGRVRRALLGDVNTDLIHLHRVVRDDVERLIVALQSYRYERDFYYRVRSLDPTALDRVNRAARMLYLNRTCYNGLYRVNREGQFNVPFGRFQNPRICDDVALRNVSRALQGVELQDWSYEAVVQLAGPGDFVFLDPPVPDRSGRRARFGRDWFDESHLGRLAEAVRLMDQRGALIMVTTRSAPETRDLFRAYDLREITAPRSPGRQARRSSRQTLVVRNFA